MPGRSSNSRPLQIVGALVALVAVVGYVAFDWRFGGSTEPTPFAIGVVVAVVAVVATAYRLLGS